MAEVDTSFTGQMDQFAAHAGALAAVFAAYEAALTREGILPERRLVLLRDYHWLLWHQVFWPGMPPRSAPIQETNDA